MSLHIIEPTAACHMMRDLARFSGDTQKGELMRRRLWLWLVGGLISGVFTHDAVHAHDHEHPELNKWFQSLKSGKGLCCDGSDAVHVADPDWETRNGHYRVRIDVSSEAGKVDMEWIDVPDEAVITAPNLSGHTLVWPFRGALGVTIRCFMPGTMT